MAKKIILIHGRSSKPRKEEKNRLVKESLLHGLKRVSQAAANKLEQGGIGFELAYYGDINNAILWAHGQRPKRDLVHNFLQAWQGQFPFEADNSYDQDLKRLFAIQTDKQSEKHYKELRAEVSDLSAVDNVLDVVSPIANLFGFNDELVNGFLPDLGAYFKYRFVGSLIRDRVQRILQSALRQTDDICLIAHGMGTIVGYDVLWKFSRMSEYSDLRDKKISRFVTLGSPLGDKVVSKQLYDVGEPEDGRFPANISVWQNFSAKDDFISRDEELRDNFEKMLDRGCVDKIVDNFIYTFWVGKDGLNPHKLYGYLDNKEVAKTIAEWIEN
jgi:hypothetical protein